MTAAVQVNSGPNVERMFGVADSAPVCDALRKLTSMLASTCPKDSVAKFEFDGMLRLHLDVRRYEDMTTAEVLLPTMCGGIFTDVQRGVADKHSFFHRLTAVVAL